MNAYIDSSVLLRVVLRESGALAEWKRIRRAFASALVRVECLRTIDRARIRFGLSDSEVAERRAAVLELLEGFEVVMINDEILQRAADPFPTTLGSLDAIHLASAMMARDFVPDLALATHDQELATAARATGFRILGAVVR